jgi:hypothetical protein
MAPSFQLNFSMERKYHRKRLDIREKTMNPWKANIFIVKEEPISMGMRKVIPKINVMLMKPLPIIIPKPSAA